MMQQRVGSWIICQYDSVDSTQRVAADRIAAGAAHRTAIVADRQTAGYGRKGDAWHDEPGASLLMTLILRPANVHDVPHLVMVAALAALDAITAVAGVRAAIKWPNDLLLDDRKVAGILGDATWRGLHLEALRLGIGMNVGGERASFVRRSLPDATSIAAAVGHDVDRQAILVALLDHFAAWEDRLEHDNADAVTDAWRRALTTIGRDVVITLRDARILRGVATGATRDGDLIVTTGDGAAVHIAATDARSLRHVSPMGNDI